MQFLYLEIVSGSEPGRRYRINSGAVSLGRNAQNSIVIPPADKCVSSHHAILYCYPDRITLQDLQSTNGTFVNETSLTEGEVRVGDIIGLGKTGPRLKLVEADRELPLQDDREPAQSKPGERATQRTGIDRTDETPVGAKPWAPGGASFAPPGGGQTMELEQKIVEHGADAKDMHRILESNGRVARILERGKVNQDQAVLLKSMQEVHKKTTRRWITVTAIIAAITLGVAVFFAVRAINYRNDLARALSLEKHLDSYESVIAQKRNNPDANRDDLNRLIVDLEKTQSDLMTIKGGLTQSDYHAFFDDPLEEAIDNILRRFGETQYHIPPEMVERVRHYVDIYSGSMNATIGRYVRRRSQYFPMITSIFRQQKLPVELAYVSMLESGFNPHALSHAGARGLWQFMPATARTYHLKVDDTVDERIEPEKATRAAAEYFKDLIGIFGGRSSVMLAMAAYNAGEGRVMGALRKIDDPMRNRDFWYIYRMGYLAQETNEYIPRVLALIIVSENPAAYGIDTGDTAPKAIADTGTDMVDLELR